MDKVAVLDVDGVLFDARSFKPHYFALLESEGIDYRVMVRTYEEAKQRGYYDIDFHLSLLIREKRSRGIEFLRRKIELFLKDAGRYVFPDAIPFLSGLTRCGYMVRLLSAGTPWFQEAKIRESGLIQRVFDVSVTAEPLKVAAFSGLYDPKAEHCVFVDDTAEVVDAIQQAFPDVLAIQLLRACDAKQVAKSRDRVVSSLDEAGELIMRPVP